MNVIKVRLGTGLFAGAVLLGSMLSAGCSKDSAKDSSPPPVNPAAASPAGDGTLQSAAAPTTATADSAGPPKQLQVPAGMGGGEVIQAN